MSSEFALNGRLGLNVRDMLKGLGKAQKETGETKKDVRELEDALDDLDATTARPKIETDDAGDAGQDAADDFVAGFDSAALAGMAAGGALAVAAFNEGMDRAHQQASFKQQFGLSPEDAERLGSQAGDIYAAGWGDSLGDVQQAIGLVDQRLVQTGIVASDEAESISTAMLATADVFGLDVTEGVESVSKMLLNGLAPDAETAMDILITGLQNGSNASGDLLESVDEYSQHFGAVGLSAEDMFAIFEHGMANGQRDTDRLADSVKEFRLRAIADTDAVSTAYSGLGLDADEYRSKVAQGGEVGRQAFLDVLHALKGVSDLQARELIAVELLGTQYEDLGPKGLDSLLAIEQGLGDVAGATDSLVEDMDAATNQMEVLWRRVSAPVYDTMQKWSEGVNHAIAGTSDLDPALEKVRDRMLELDEAVQASEKSGDALTDELMELGFTAEEIAGYILDVDKAQLRASKSADETARAVDSNAQAMVNASIDAALLEQQTNSTAASTDEFARDALRAAEHALTSEAQAADTATVSIGDLMNAQRAMADPAFAAMQAQDGLTRALETLNAEGGNTPENMAHVVRAQLSLDAANAELAASTDDVTASVIEMGIRAGLTEEQAWALGASVADAKDNADDFAGSYVAEVSATGVAETNAGIDHMARDRVATIRINQEGAVTLPSGTRVYDSGGRIPAGETGLVAERRPELVNGALLMHPMLVQGPADVTGGAATAAMLGGRGAAGGMIPPAASVGSSGSVSTLDQVTLIVEGEPITARIVAHDQRAASKLLASL